MQEAKGNKPILLVEDEAVLRESVRDWLSDIGYQVETTGDGEQALRTIAEREFGLLILDLRLPGKDGIEVLREARARHPQLKGIIITAYPSVETAVEAMREGAIAYIPKPFDLNRLEAVIRDSLGPVQIELKPKAVPAKAAADVVTLSINDQKVEVRQGMTVLQAAQSAEIDIPTLCYHEKLSPYGACRLCTVELIKGQRSRLVTSCAYPVEEGLIVKTDSEPLPTTACDVNKV